MAETVTFIPGVSCPESCLKGKGSFWYRREVPEPEIRIMRGVFMDREALIKRIVEEKGEKAIPALINLIDDGDAEVTELCLDALVELGEQGIEAILEKVRGVVERSEKDDIDALFLVDVLGEVGYEKAVPVLYSLLGLYDDESAQVVIYEALARLGEGEKVADILSIMIDEADESDFRDQLIMALCYTGSAKAVKALGRVYNRPTLDKSTRAFVLEGFHMLISNRPELMAFVKSLPQGEEIMKKLYLWSKDNYDN